MKKKDKKRHKIANLEYYIAKYTLPKLKKFQKTTYSMPPDMNLEQWKEIIGEMIYGLEASANQDWEFNKERDYKRVKKGLKLFGKYFRDLWI